MPALIWLASYPKSGSTWLRTALHILQHGPLRSSAALELTMPSIHGDNAERWHSAARAGGIVLTHKAPASHQERYPLGEGVLQLVRHPADVLLSDARYFALTQLDRWLLKQGRTQPQPGDLETLVSMHLTAVVNTGTTPRATQLGFGSWADNVDGWATHSSDRPGLLVRYEDLKARPAAELTRIADALGLPTTALNLAVQGSSLGAMKQLQEREIQRREPGRFYEARHEKAYKAGLRFVSQGQVGQGGRLPSAALRALHARWGTVAARFGYSLAPDTDPVTPLPEPLQAARPLPR